MLNKELLNILEQLKFIGPGSLSIVLITAFFISLVFSLQVVKEFLYLGTVSLIGAVLTLAFIRELCPVLTCVIVIGRVCSSFTAELATMQVTDQVDALYLLRTNPLVYLVLPRVIACLIALPVLNLLSFATSLASSAFICFFIYNIDPLIFFSSSFIALSKSDVLKSCIKVFVFALSISIISCYFGLSANGGSKGVGKSTTVSVVCCLLVIFFMDFVLSYYMFNQIYSSIEDL